MANRTLYLVRHGQYDTAVNLRDGGGLTALGKQQAEYAGKALAETPITKIYASTMVRAIETANIIAHMVKANYMVSDLLREAIPSIPPRLATQILMMMEQDPELTHEAIHEDQVRADEAFEHFFRPPPDDDPIAVVLVCHGNIMRYLTCKALGVNTDTWAKLSIHHCGITTIVVEQSGLMRLVTHNETRHLPVELVTD
jgi:serine/threonine-protein phosphatase PGAM5